MHCLCAMKMHNLPVWHRVVREQMLAKRGSLNVFKLIQAHVCWS